ncbi:MAG: NERD domain-containing protein [Lutisporaceae bacterium]
MTLIDKAIYALINGKKTINEPIFMKEFKKENQQLIDLIELSKKVVSDKKENIDRDIAFLKQGLDGEQNVAYELKNSFVPMLILHDIRLEFNDYVAQMDFVLITHKFIYVLETKKLNGDIEITRDGDFIRSFKTNAGKVFKKEGIYSPISQNTRHVTILKEMLTKTGLIKSYPIKSAVIIANPKTILNKAKCPKTIQNQLYKYDQLTVLVKKELDKFKEEMAYREKQMYKIAEFLLMNNKPISFDNIAKYSLTEEDFVNNKQAVTPQPKTFQEVPVVAEQPLKETPAVEPVKLIALQPKVVTKTKLEETAVYKALKEYRLNTSRKENIKPYLVYNNDEMESIICVNPKTKADLLTCKGFGEKKFEKYGNSILEILKNNQEST